MLSACVFVSLIFVAVVTCNSCVSPPQSTGEWVVYDAPDPKLALRFTINLHHRNLDVLEKELLAVSDPKNPRYGQYYTLEQVNDLVGPSDEHVNAVIQWVEKYGNPQFSLGRDYAHVELTVSEAERLFGIKLMMFRHPRRSTPIIRSVTPFCLPSHLVEIVHFVDGLFDFPNIRSGQIHGRSSDNPKALQPSDLYVYYTVTEAKTSVYPSSQAPVQFGANYFNYSDLQAFEKKYVPAVVGQTINQVFGVNTDTKTSVEANLDVQYIIAMGNFVNTSVYIQPCGALQSIVNCFLDYTYVVGNQTSPPLVHSISYGEYGGSYDNTTVQRLNQQFMKMGIRGISILLASGDNGVGCNKDCSSFEFDFPSSPYITMVGATYFDSTTGLEKGATLSSGGFSLDYYRPSYQDSAVNGYFNSGVQLPSPSMYYRNGRAYPDVAAAGENLAIIVNGKTEYVSGTSCSAPIFAGLISLLNNQRFQSGKASLGFLNPWLYQNPSMFNPINTGNNQYCPPGSGCCCSGFNGANGWDPVTGLGSPNYAKMLAVSKATP